jgi:Fibronectin type III domain.
MKKLRLFIMMLMAAMLPLAVQAQVSLPYTYGFENNDLSADGWTTVDCHEQSAINSAAANSGTYSFRFHWTTNPPQYLISPELNGTDAGVEVAFYYKSNSTTFTETFMVGYSTTTNDIASFTWGEEMEEPNGTWTLYSNTFPAGTKYIAIQCTSNDQFYFYLDDFTFEAPATCPKPTGLAHSNVTAHTVDLSWTAGGTETEWTIDANGTETTGVTTNPYTLTGLTAGTAYTVKVKANCSATDASNWSNTVSFTTEPTCIAPSAVTVTPGSVTATSAEISWTDNNETDPANGWTIDVNGTEVAAATNPFTLDDLTAATTYTVKVKANCDADDASAWSSTVSFTTPCVTVVVTETTPFTEDFNTLTTGIPNCWDNTDGTSSSYYRWAYNANGASGACVRFNSYTNSNGNTNMLKTPVLDITQLTNPCVTFNYKNPTGGDFSVFVSTDGGATYTTALATGLTDMTDWSSLTLMLSGLDATDNVVIVFQGTSNYGNGDAYIYLDDVTVGEAPACVAPNGLAANNVTATSADIAWTANNGETEWTIEVNGTEMTGITENPYTLTTTANTEYTVRVKANCSATDESDWSGTYTFTTPCAAVATVEEDFEAYTEGLPDCWAKLGAGTVTVQTSQPNSGSKSLRFSGTTGTNIVALPALESYAGLYLTFSTKPESNSYTNCGSFAVGYVTGDASTFQALATYNYNDTDFDGDVYAVMSIDVSSVPANALLAFNHMSEASYYYWFVDDVNVAAAPTCLRPTDVTVSDITTTSAVLSWTANNGETSWSLELDGVESPVNVTSNPFTLTGLYPQTSYTVRIRANCDTDNSSDWSTPVVFNTECGVFPVTDANPYRDDFEGDDNFVCWTSEPISGSDNWVVDHGYLIVNNAAFFSWLGDEARLISLPLDLTAVTDPYLFFKRKQSQGYTDVDALSVWYRTSATDEWHSIAQYLFPTNGYEQVAVALPQPSATYQIAFQAKSNNAEGVYVDDVVVGDFSVGISDNQPFEVAVYPNPTTGYVTVESDAVGADITVFDAFGKLMMSSKVAAERTELNFCGFASGVYMVRIATATGVSTFKVVKE